MLEANLITTDMNKPPGVVAIALERNSWDIFVKSVVVCILNEL